MPDDFPTIAGFVPTRDEWLLAMRANASLALALGEREQELAVTEAARVHTQRRLTELEEYHDKYALFCARTFDRACKQRDHWKARAKRLLCISKDWRDAYGSFIPERSE